MVLILKSPPHSPLPHRETQFVFFLDQPLWSLEQQSLLFVFVHLCWSTNHFVASCVLYSPFGPTTMLIHYFCQRHFIFIFGSETPLYPFSLWSHIVTFYTTWCHGCLFWPFLISQPAILRGLDITLHFPQLKSGSLAHRLYFVHGCLCVCCAHGLAGSETTPYIPTTYTARAYAHCKW